MAVVGGPATLQGRISRSAFDPLPQLTNYQRLGKSADAQA